MGQHTGERSFRKIPVLIPWHTQYCKSTLLFWLLFWGELYLHFNEQWMSICIGKKYPQASSVLWVGPERSYIGILKKISGCPCCRHEGTLHCRRENNGSILPVVTPMNQDMTKGGKNKCVEVFQLFWHIAILICSPAIHTASLLPAVALHHENHWTKFTT